MKQWLARILIMVLLLPLLPVFDLTAEAASTDENISHYICSNAWKASDEESIVSGTEYSNVTIFQMGYTGLSHGDIARAAYHLDGNYSRFSFCAGTHSGWERDATMSVFADGVTIVDEVKFTYGAAPRSFNLNVAGVTKLVIQFTSSGYDKTRCFIGNTKAVWQNNEDEKVLVSDEFYDVVRSSSRYARLVTGKADMGGYSYENGYTIELGYGFNTGETGNIAFNFDGKYKKLKFHIGRYESSKHANYLRSAYLTIDADGKVLSGYDKREIKWDDLALPVEVDLNGVKTLTITLTSSGYDRLYWFLGNFELESDRNAHGVLLDANSVTLTSKNPNYDLNPRVYPSDARNKNITVESDKSIIAAVDGEGNVYGRHKGSTTVTVTTEDGGHTATCKINSELPAARFVPSVDGWGFGNLEVDGTKDFYDDVYERICGEAYSYSMFDSGLASVINKIATAPQFFYYAIPRLLLGGGVCHGMSFTAAVTYTKSIPFSTWEWNSGSYSTPFDVKTYSESDGYSSSLDMYLSQLVVAGAFTQMSWPTLQEQNATKNDFKALFDAVKHFQNTGKDPVLLKMIQSGGTHTVLPYEIMQVGNVVNMFIYDPNAANHPELDTDEIAIRFSVDDDGNVINWVYDVDSIGGYSKANTDLCPLTNLSVYIDRIKQQQKYPFPENIAYVSTSDFSVSKNGKTLLSCNNGSYSVAEGQEAALPVILAASAAKASGNNGLVALASGDDFTVKLNSSARTTTGLYLGSNAFIVESGGKAQISKTAAGKGQSLSVNSGSDQQLSIRYNRDDDSIILSGTAPEKATVTIDENGNASFTGYSSVQLTVIRDGKTTTGQREILQPGSVYNVSENAQPIIQAERRLIKAYAYKDCASMTDFEIPDGINAIGEYAFQNCSGLKSLLLPADILYIGANAFEGCTNLTLIVSSGSYAQAYCEEWNLPYTLAN